MMHSVYRWLIGLRQLPNETAGGKSHFELQSLPTGLAAVGCLVLAVAAVVGIWFLYRLEGRNLTRGARTLLAGLRVAILAAVVLMLFDLVLVIERHEAIPSQMLVLVDTSQSMGLVDPYPDESAARRLAGGLHLTGADGQPAPQKLIDLSRLDVTRKALEPILPELGKGRVVSIYGFDSRAIKLEGDATLASLKPVGNSTATGDAIKQALAAHRGQPLAGMLVVSDGQSNAGEDPRKIAQQAGREGTMINAIAVGSEHGPSNVRMVDLEASPAVFVRDPTQLVAVVESQGLKGRTSIIRLERRQGGGDWTELAQTELILGEDGAVQRVAFGFVPDTIGQNEFRASVQDAGAELTEADNSVIKPVKVVRQRIRVLLIAGSPSFEMQFLRNALLRDPQIEFVSWLQSAGEGYEQIGHRPLKRLPNNLQELAHYDVVVLLDPNMPELGPTWNELLLKFVGEAGGGLIYVAGELNSQKLLEGHSADPGSEESWVQMLPVVSEPGLYQSAAEVRLSSRDTWNLELTADGSEDAIFRFSPDQNKNKEILASLPGMYWHFPVTRAKPGALVLAQHGDQRMQNQFGRHVLTAMQRYGPGRTVFIGFDSTYRWRYLHEQYFDGFWARMIDRVGRSKVLGGRYPFTLTVDKSVYRTGDRVKLHVQSVGGQEDADLLSQLRGEVDIPGDEPMQLDLEPVAGQPGLLETSFPVEKGGEYAVRVTTNSVSDREASAQPATLAFRVEPPRQELDRPGLNRALLDETARATGGRVFAPEEASEIPAAFNIHEVDRVLTYREELWDAPLWAFLVVGLLTVEWVLRKRWRMA